MISLLSILRSLKKCILFFYSHSELPEIVTPIFKLKKESIHNPAVVKALINKNCEAIYFSRSALPHIREINKDEWHSHHDFWGHVGIYGFRADILSAWRTLSQSNLEKNEKLEQLRFIDSGIKISTFKVEGNFLSIDTSEQLEEVRKNLNANNLKF